MSALNEAAASHRGCSELPESAAPARTEPAALPVELRPSANDVVRRSRPPPFETRRAVRRTRLGLSRAFRSSPPPMNALGWRLPVWNDPPARPPDLPALPLRQIFRPLAGRRNMSPSRDAEPPARKSTDPPRNAGFPKGSVRPPRRARQLQSDRPEGVHPCLRPVASRRYPANLLSPTPRAPSQALGRTRQWSTRHPP